MNIARLIQYPALGALNLLSPPACFLCGKPTHRGRRALCWDCLTRPLLSSEEKLCRICGARVNVANAVCADCGHRRPPFWQARAAAFFQGDVRHLVHLFKYRKSIWLCNDFADWLHGCYLAHYADAVVDCLVPVPVSRLKRFMRCYNQSELLARELGRRLSLPVAVNALKRKGGLSTQTRFSRRERERHAARVFQIQSASAIKDKNVLLVDDVFTTGATASACARALIRGGAESVRVITVARGVLD